MVYVFHKIKPQKTRDFGYWLFSKPKAGNTPRSTEKINNNISEVLRAYKNIAIRDNYISKNQAPEIDRLKEQPDETHKRDILMLRLRPADARRAEAGVL